MLTIRLQRTGRTGHAQFRLIAQDRRFSPLSGRVVAYLGSYNPHSKEVKLDNDKIAEYLKQGAQPSPRAIKLLKAEGIKLPKWVVEPAPKKRSIRNPEKLRKNRPAEPKAETAATESTEAAAEPAADTTEASPTEETSAETEVDATAETSSETAPEPQAEPATEQAETADKNTEAAAEESSET